MKHYNTQDNNGLTWYLYSKQVKQGGAGHKYSTITVYFFSPDKNKHANKLEAIPEGKRLFRTEAIGIPFVR